MNCGNGDANGGEGEEDGGDVAMLTDRSALGSAPGLRLKLAGGAWTWLAVVVRMQISMATTAIPTTEQKKKPRLPWMGVRARVRGPGSGPRSGLGCQSRQQES